MTSPVPVDGLIDLVDDRPCLRTDGYLPSPSDLPIAAAEMRRALSGPDRKETMAQLLKQLRATPTNAELLQKISYA